MKTIQTKGPKLIQEKVIVLRADFDYTHISHRRLYFLAACVFLEPEIDVEIALKLRLFDGLIGNNRLLIEKQQCFETSRSLTWRSSFIKECIEKGPDMFMLSGTSHWTIVYLVIWLDYYSLFPCNFSSLAYSVIWYARQRWVKNVVVIDLEVF